MTDDLYYDRKYLLLSRPLPFNHFSYFKNRLLQIKLARRTNAPYLSGDSFAELADYWVYGKRSDSRLNLKKLRKSKIIFVSGSNLYKLLSENWQDINATVIISGNSDENFDNLINFPESVKLWLCQNNSMPNSISKITLPVGIENLRLARLGFPDLYSRLNSKEIVQRVAIPPMSATNPIRFEIVKISLRHPEIFDVFRDYLQHEIYIETFRKYQFIFCCEGNGYESHRIWESLYRGSFPVMLNTRWARTIKDLGLPILLVNKLEDIDSDLLDSHYQEWQNFNPKDCNVLWIDHWKKLINSYL
jgi:hypothetical protein